jgi:hypothetical protein
LLKFLIATAKTKWQTGAEDSWMELHHNVFDSHRCPIMDAGGRQRQLENNLTKGWSTPYPSAPRGVPRLSC